MVFGHGEDGGDKNKRGTSRRTLNVKCAFLQSYLKESIFLRAPPGYSSTTADGEEEILELSRAIYGLKQSSKRKLTSQHNKP